MEFKAMKKRLRKSNLKLGINAKEYGVLQAKC